MNNRANNTFNGTFYSVALFVYHSAKAAFSHKQINTVKRPLMRRYVRHEVV